MEMSLNQFLDTHYGPDGDAVLKTRLENGENPDAMENGETALHVAVRRRRESAVAILLDHGVDIDARNAWGKTAFAHAIRRGFYELFDLLAMNSADQSLTPADKLAVFLTHGQLSRAEDILREHPGCVRTGNPEEDRLLADLAGRQETEPVSLLIAAGADLSAPALDDGTPLHQAAWFGQPQNARLLIDAGAPIDVFDQVHNSSPLGWAVHGSRYSGDADKRQEAYVELVRMLLEAGASLHYPGDSGPAYLNRLREDASPAVKGLLQ